MFRVIVGQVRRWIFPYKLSLTVSVVEHVFFPLRASGRSRTYGSKHVLKCRCVQVMMMGPAGGLATVGTACSAAALSATREL